MTALGVAIVFAGLVVLIGLAAAAWRLGDAIVALRPIARIGRDAPPTLVALLGASLLYILMQLPVLGQLISLAVLAYALGVVAAARLAPPAPAA